MDQINIRYFIDKCEIFLFRNDSYIYRQTDYKKNVKYQKKKKFLHIFLDNNSYIRTFPRLFKYCWDIRTPSRNTRHSRILRNVWPPYFTVHFTENKNKTKRKRFRFFSHLSKSNFEHVYFSPKLKYFRWLKHEKFNIVFIFIFSLLCILFIYLFYIIKSLLICSLLFDCWRKTIFFVLEEKGYGRYRLCSLVNQLITFLHIF